ncbi:MAG: hypothetical protein ACO30M_03265, partial [Candidatus Kapaibacteriota bacterium]
MFLLLLSLLNVTNADVYMHNPRGSNNRCDRRTNDRANANRLFDSQNNAAGGYAIPCDRLSDDNINCYKMKYYEGSELEIRWTLQHNCGSLNNCNVILQYSCEDPNLLGINIRDGKPQNINGNTCEETIPLLDDEFIQNKEKYGKHEELNHYKNCVDSYRNPGLPVFDQRLRGNKAIYTRQNPNGNRYGFECPEERDYYPYWRDSPWIDIAVITNQIELCNFYKEESQNVKNRTFCTGASKYIFNLTECEQYGGRLIKKESFRELNFPVKEPECVPFKSTPHTNRLSESNEHNTQFYKWILPSFGKNMSNCILRVRYNISTNEVLNGNIVLKNNPQLNTTIGVPVRLAVDTSQYGRTFEDRSFTFDIIKREAVKERIINVNVQGKRGNIAQIRNCVEYDFVPNNLTVSNDDLLHFQWVGSDYNPPENDGEGKAGTDRSNLVFVDDLKDNFPSTQMNIFDIDSLISLASINQPYLNNTLCKFPNNNEQSIDNCAILNYAPPYFNMKLIKINSNQTNINKTVYAISTRNNNFSNRDQKLILNIVSTKSELKESVNLNESNNNNKYVVGFIFLGIILFVICVCIVIYIRKNDITFSKIKKQIERNFS